MRAVTNPHHLLAILPRGETIRNFVYTRVLDRIAAETRLSVLSVRPNAEIWRLLESRYPSVTELTMLPERKLVWQLRELLDMAHGRWLWTQAAQTRWKARDSEATSAASRVKRVLKKLACYPLANQPGLKLLSEIERRSSYWLSETDEAVELLKRLKPTLVFNASHSHSPSALAWVQAAETLGIPTATFLFSWDNLTSQGRIFARYNHYLAWSDDIRADLLRIYPDIKPDQVIVTGTPQFDPHFQQENYWTREEFCARVGADPKRPIVLYTTSMPRPAMGEPRIVEGIARILRELQECGPPQLLVRVYPKDRTGRFEEIKSRCPDVLFPAVAWDPNWLTPLPADSATLTNTLRHADLGINVASTVSLELCMFGKPVINVGYDPPGVDIRPFDYPSFYEFDHYRPVAQSGAITMAWSEDQMPALIRQALVSPSQNQTSQSALLARMFGGMLDGASSDRIARTLIRLTGAVVNRAAPEPLSVRMLPSSADATAQEASAEAVTESR